jgi:hypothetical protein
LYFIHSPLITFAAGKIGFGLLNLIIRRM